MQRDEIDLKKYILAILNGWKVMLILSVFGAGLAYAAIKLQTPLYSSASSIYVGIPSSYMAFDERMGSTIATASTRTIDYKAMLDIATSRELMRKAWEQSGVSAEIAFGEFQNNASAANGSSPANIRFTVTLADGEVSAALANAWAESAADQLNAIIVGIDRESIAALDDQKNLAEQTVRETASAVSAFEQENHLTFLEQNLSVMLAQRETLLLAAPQEIADRDARLKKLETDITTAQQNLIALKARKALLESNYDRAIQTYAILIAKLDEARVAVAVGNSFAHITDRARVSTAPNQQEWKTIAILAAAAGLLIGALIAVLQVWWQDDPAASR